MKRWIFALVMVFACFQTAFALLPPYFQSVKEIEEILQDQRLHDLLGSGQPILEIQKVGSSYHILTMKYFLKINVHYIPRGMPGPAQFELEFEQPQEINQAQEAL